MSLYNTLYNWQRNIVDKFKDKESYGLFLDMGLGKTILSLAFTEVNKCDKILIITINAKAIEDENVKGSWFYWLKQSNINYKLLNKKSPDVIFDDSNEALIINYESLYERNKNQSKGITLKSVVKSFIKSCKNKNVAIIVDESHKMKSSQSIQTKAIMQIKRDLSIKSNKLYSYLLTGTPFTKGYEDLYSQLKFLGYSQTKTAFIDNYCIRGRIAGLYDWQQPIVGYKNLDILFELIHNYAVTIKSEDMVNLPDMIYVNHELESSEQFKLFTNEKIQGMDIVCENKKRTIKLLDDNKYITTKKVNNPYYRNIAAPDDKWLAETSGQFWLRARELSIGFQGNAEEATWYDKSRLNELKTFLENNVDNYVLFYNYTPELLEIYNICEALDYNIDVYCGEIKTQHFYEKYCNLSDSEKLTNKNNIIIANFASGATGINWQEYNKCIIFSIPLYDDYAQAIKRIHRLGQKNTVIYHTFYQNNWLDLGMKKSLDDKCNYSLQMFESDINRINSLK